MLYKQNSISTLCILVYYL